MTTDQLSRAAGLKEKIASIERELSAWEAHGHNKVVHPLTFRLGGALEHIPPQVLWAFRLACVTDMDERLKELHREFERL